MRKAVVLLSVAAMFFTASGRAFSQDVKDEKANGITHENRLALVRSIVGEYVKVMKPLPCEKKKRFVVKAGESPKNDEKSDGIKIKPRGNSCETTPGAKMQITSLGLDEKNKIVVDLNGGTNPKKGLRQKISEHGSVQLSGGGQGIDILKPPKEDPKVDPAGQPPGFQKTPATIVLEFNGPVPTPDEFKQYLSAVLDFSNERSAAVQWIDTRSPEVRKAISDKRVIVGMDEEEVIAAVGKPTCSLGHTLANKPDLCKSREMDERSGVEVETWMYGTAPFITFVDFVNGKVVRIKNP